MAHQTLAEHSAPPAHSAHAAHPAHPAHSRDTTPVPAPTGVGIGDRIWTTGLGQHIGKQVVLKGWLHHQRQFRNVSFIVLRDARGTAQVVIEDRAVREQVAGLEHETVLAITGQVAAVPQAPNGVELHHPTIEVIAPAVAPPPFELFRPVLASPLPALLDHAPVLLRHPRQRALFHLASAAMAGFRKTLRALDFVEVQTPKLVGSATEGGANVFTVDYFGQPAYLSQSPQLYKQMLVGVFERVYEVGPAFRAEPHDTPRHLNEFVSLDVELGFIRDHTEVMALLVAVLRGMLATIQEEDADALHQLGLRLPLLPEQVPVLDFQHALELIAQDTGTDTREEADLAPAHERWLGEWAQRTHGSDFLFVTGYPLATKPFYTAPDPARPSYTNSFDLLFRGMELVSGGQRLHRAEDYAAALRSRGMDPAGFAGYLEAFRHGMPPHGGFAIGLERFIARLANLPNVRETTLFPRDLHRLTP